MILPAQIFRRITWRVGLLLTGLIALLFCMGVWLYQLERQSLLEQEIQQEQTRLSQLASEMEFMLAQAWQNGQYLARLLVLHIDQKEGKVAKMDQRIFHPFLALHPTLYRVSMFNEKGKQTLDIVNPKTVGHEHYSAIELANFYYLLGNKQEKIIDLGVHEKTNERILGFVYPIDTRADGTHMMLILTSMHALLPHALVTGELTKKHIAIVNDQQVPLMGDTPDQGMLMLLQNQDDALKIDSQSKKADKLKHHAHKLHYQLAPIHLAIFDRDWMLVRKCHDEPSNHSLHVLAWLFGIGALLLIICFFVVSYYFILKKIDRVVNTHPSDSPLLYGSGIDGTDEKVTRQVLVEANQVLHRLAHIDALTGLSNRRSFDLALAREWQKAIKYHEPISLIMIDVDCFKAFNDRYGHKTGDECLQKVSEVLRLEVRRMSDIVARYGGEEFALILPNTPLHDATKIAWNLRQRVFDLHVPHQGSTVLDVVTISCGVASMWPDHEATPDDLIRRADKALYNAKRAGRNTVEC